jgi:pimeloyl-ACP methyl ester carboxylesterase
MIEQIQFFLEDIVKEPCAIIASSDACTYAIEVARRAREHVRSLLLICPPVARDNNTLAPHETFGRVALQKIASLPVVGTTLVNYIASRRGIENFSTHHLYFDKARVDDRTVSRYYASAHQPDTKYGIASFVTGALAHDAREAWSEIAQPALLVWGRNARINPLETAPEWLALKPDARLEVIGDAMLLPHQEHADRFNALALDWLHA